MLRKMEVDSARDTRVTMNEGSTSCNLENLLHDQESQTDNMSKLTIISKFKLGRTFIEFDLTLTREEPKATHNII